MHSLLSTGLRLFCCLAIAAQPVFVRACLNDYDHRPPEPGTPNATAREYAHWLRVRPERQDDLQSELKERAARAKEGTYRGQSDNAVALLRAGEYVQGCYILQKLAVEHGDEYIIAANLGTAYELTGDVPNALEWIRKGNQINPESHNGTEWLHVKILEAKLQAAQDKDWFAKNTTLGLDFGKEAKPEQPNNTIRDNQQKELSLQDIRKALEYQLHERTQFIQDDDPQMSELFLTLGNILALQGEPLKAYEVFRIAQDYAPITTPLLEAKITAYHPEPVSPHDRMERNIKIGLIVAASLLGAAVFALTLYVIRRSRRPKTVG
jgi:tetratricopeptide (TPR) repeat protein